MEIELDDDQIITGIRVQGGCNGNLQGLSALVIGRKAEVVASLLQGINCGGRGTSCPDQLSKALAEMTHGEGG